MNMPGLLSCLTFHLSTLHACTPMSLNWRWSSNLPSLALRPGNLPGIYKLNNVPPWQVHLWLRTVLGHGGLSGLPDVAVRRAHQSLWSLIRAGQKCEGRLLRPSHRLHISWTICWASDECYSTSTGFRRSDVLARRGFLVIRFKGQDRGLFSVRTSHHRSLNVDHFSRSWKITATPRTPASTAWWCTGPPPRRRWATSVDLRRWCRLEAKIWEQKTCGKNSNRGPNWSYTGLPHSWQQTV